MIRDMNPSRDIYSVVYLGGNVTKTPLSNKIRREMIRQCVTRSPNNKKTHCSWYPLDHFAVADKLDSMTSVYEKNTFCLNPPGDDPARKATFDILLAGCIPVVLLHLFILLICVFLYGYRYLIGFSL